MKIIFTLEFPKLLKSEIFLIFLKFYKTSWQISMLFLLKPSLNNLWLWLCPIVSLLAYYLSMFDAYISSTYLAFAVISFALPLHWQ